MALICDTGGVYAIHDADDPYHAAVKFVVEVEPGQLYLPVILLAEIDYLLTSRLGIDAALDFLDSVECGAFTLISPTTEDIVRCRELIVQYRDLSVGLANASVVATAERAYGDASGGLPEWNDFITQIPSGAFSTPTTRRSSGRLRQTTNSHWMRRSETLGSNRSVCSRPRWLRTVSKARCT